jgi:hypothetical protein
MIISDPTLALQTITDIAQHTPANRISTLLDARGGDLFNGQGFTLRDAINLLARATECDPVSQYTQYGYHHTVADEAARGMNPPQWAVPGTMSTGKSVVVLLSITDWPMPNSLNIQGLADAN